MLEGFFSVPTLAEAQAIAATGTTLNAKGIILWAIVKPFLIIYLVIGILFFIGYVIYYFRDAWKFSYGSKTSSNKKEDFERRLGSNFDAFWVGFFMHVLLWPMALWIWAGDIKLSGVFGFILDKYDRSKNPERYI